MNAVDRDAYKKWLPIEGNLTRLECEAIHDDYEGFRILLRSSESGLGVLRISFATSLAYRNMDEGKRIRTIEASQFDGHTLYTVENSTWLEWFHEESCGTLREIDIVHYAIYTPNDCIDVLSEVTPQVEWI